MATTAASRATSTGSSAAGTASAGTAGTPAPDGHLPARLAVIGAAVATAAICWAIADPVAGVDLVVRAGSSMQTIGAADMVVAALGIGLLGLGALVLLERMTRHGGRNWAILAAIVLLVSLAGPLGAATASAGAALAATHLLVGGLLLVGLGRTTRSAPIVWNQAGRR